MFDCKTFMYYIRYIYNMKHLCFTDATGHVRLIEAISVTKTSNVKAYLLVIYIVLLITFAILIVLKEVHYVAVKIFHVAVKKI